MVKIGSQNVKSEDDVQGDPKPVPGRYHAVVKGVQFMMKDSDGKLVEVDEDMAEKIIFQFEALAGTVPGQAGREIQEYFALTEKALPRLQRLALCVGLLSPGEAEKEIHFSQAIGRQLVIEVEENQYTNRNGQEVKSVRVGYMGLWSLGNAAVADVPKDAEATKLAVGGAPAEPPPQEEPAPASAGQAGSDDKWAGL